MRKIKKFGAIWILGGYYPLCLPWLCLWQFCKLYHLQSLYSSTDIAQLCARITIFFNCIVGPFHIKHTNDTFEMEKNTVVKSSKNHSSNARPFCIMNVRKMLLNLISWQPNTMTVETYILAIVWAEKWRFFRVALKRAYRFAISLFLIWCPVFVLDDACCNSCDKRCSYLKPMYQMSGRVYLLPPLCVTCMRVDCGRIKCNYWTPGADWK